MSVNYGKGVGLPGSFTISCHEFQMRPVSMRVGAPVCSGINTKRSRVGFKQTWHLPGKQEAIRDEQGC